MSLKNTFYEVGILKAKKQSVVIDALTEEAPILKSLPVEASSDGLYNVAEKLIDVSGAGLVDLDGVLPTVSADGKLEQIQLSTFGGQIEVGEDKANQMGGKDAYFARRLPTIMKSTGEQIEKSIIYNNIRAYAIANSNTITAGGSANVNYSMLCVKWSPGETTGLYDPAGFGAGEAMDIANINGGNIYKDTDGRLVYGLRLKSNFGIQLLNERYVSALVNIDYINNASGFTAEKIDEMINAARGADGRAVIYAHPNVVTYMQKFKADKLQYFTDTTNLERRFAMWNGTLVIPSYNFLMATEANV